MIIRLFYITLSLILILSLNGKMVTAEGPMKSRFMELFYLTTTQQKRFESLSPEEQDRIIRNYREYQRLPKNQRQKLKDNYMQWQKMSPQERKKLKELYERYKGTSPQ